MSRKIVLLGATGSIGTQALSLLKGNDEYELVGISADRNVDKVLEILSVFPSVGFVAMASNAKAKVIRETRPDVDVFSGDAANIQLIDEADPDVVLNSILGFDGFLPSLHVLRKNKILLLANKETMVVGGRFINEELRKGNGKVYPIDSEHVALAKCIADASGKEIKELYITASGGALRDYPIKQISMAPVNAVLNHPTWKMGAKITVDCATMVNKAYEVIEASMLFDRPVDEIKAYIERNSLIHGGVVLEDGTKLCEHSPNTMLIPIQYALSLGTEKRHVPTGEEEVEIGKLSMEPIDNNRYPMFGFILDLVKRYPDRASIIVNAVDEVVVKAYLDQKIRFGDLETILRKVSSSLTRDERNPKDLRGVIELDKKARETAEHMVEVFATALANGNDPSVTISKPVRDASRKHAEKNISKEERRKEKKSSRWRNDPSKKLLVKQHASDKLKKKKEEESSEKKTKTARSTKANDTQRIKSFGEFMDENAANDSKKKSFHKTNGHKSFNNHGKHSHDSFDKSDRKDWRKSKKPLKKSYSKDGTKKSFDRKGPSKTIYKGRSSYNRDRKGSSFGRDDRKKSYRIPRKNPHRAG